jgi:hypothetical protein
MRVVGEKFMIESAKEMSFASDEFCAVNWVLEVSSMTKSLRTFT